MNSDTNPKVKRKGFAQVPHGIVDATVPDMLKLLLWYCYDKPTDWTFSVPEVVRSLRKTPQCIREYFREFLGAGVFTKAGTKPVKHGLVPLYRFHRDRVDGFIKTKLKVDPETDPETDWETDVETNPETDPETGRTHTNTDLPKLSTEKNGTENHHTKGVDVSASSNPASGSSQAACGGVQVEDLSSEDLKKAFEDLEKDLQAQVPNPLMKEIKPGPLFKSRDGINLKGLDDLFGFNPDA